MSKLKGCRESAVVNQELLNTYADLGHSNFRLKDLPKKIDQIHKRIEELQLEFSAAQQQEAAMKAKEAAQSENKDKDGIVYEPCMDAEIPDVAV